VSGDSGASSIELVMYTPILMLVTFLIVQFALTWHGQEIAGVVAREAAREARIGGGTPEALADGEAKGRQYATVVGGKALGEVTVQVVLVGDDQVRATVTGRSVELVPGFAPRVRAQVEGPVETFRPDR
jgi:Flp pilus assembly protein TadG